MEQDLLEALDESLKLLKTNQATLDECLARYPSLAADLRPLLETAIEVRRAPLPVPSPAASVVGKRRMLQALAEKKRRQSVSPSLVPRFAGWIETLFGARERTTKQKRTLIFKLSLATASASALALVLLVTGVLLLHSWTSTVVAQTATLADLSGVVQVLPTSSSTWQPAEPGDRVATGDRIRTDTSSSVTLIFFDGSATSLEAETELTVSRLSGRRDGRDKVILLYQWEGRTHNRVQRLLDTAFRFEIETPTAVTAVRGTEFDVEVMPDGTTHVAVEEGIVKVMTQETTVELQPGEATTVAPRPTPTPEPTETPEPAETEEPEEPTEAPEPTETPDDDDDGDDADDDGGGDEGDGDEGDDGDGGDDDDNDDDDGDNDNDDNDHGDDNDDHGGGGDGDEKDDDDKDDDDGDDKDGDDDDG